MYSSNQLFIFKSFLSIVSSSKTLSSHSMSIQVCFYLKLLVASYVHISALEQVTFFELYVICYLATCKVFFVSCYQLKNRI